MRSQVAVSYGLLINCRHLLDRPRNGPYALLRDRDPLLAGWELARRNVDAFIPFNTRLIPSSPAEIKHKLTSPAFYFVALAVLTSVYLVCSIRTNFCLFSALFLLVITFGLFAGAYFNLAEGQHELAANLQLVSAFSGLLDAG